MQDFAKVDRNLKRLFAANAPDADIESYLSSEGVTSDQMVQYQPSPVQQPSATMQPGAAPDPREQFRAQLRPGAPAMQPQPIAQQGMPPLPMQRDAAPPQMPPQAQPVVAQPPPQMAQLRPPPAAPVMPPQAAPQLQFPEGTPGADRLRQLKSDPGFLDTYVQPALNAVGDAAMGAGKAVVGAVQGKHDPKYKDVPQLEKNSGIMMDGFADMTAVTDSSYADVWAKALGDRYIGTFNDANGYPIVRFKGKDGSEQLGYVNKPGLDYQDVSRGLSASVPYLMAGGIAGRALGALGTGANVVGQSLAAGVASLAQDGGASTIGSKQGLDDMKLLVSMGAGGIGELVGRAVVPFVMKWRSSADVWKKDAMGNITLTDKGKMLAKKEGLDPDISIDVAQARKVMDETATAKSPGEAIIKSRTDQFGIPSSGAQRSRNPLEIQLEKDLRIDTLGPAAGKQMRDFDTKQADALRGAALGDGATGFKSVGPELNPKRNMNNIAPDDLGESVQRGYQAARKSAKEMETAAWSNVHNVTPKAGAFELMPKIVRKRLGVDEIDKDLHPAAFKMSKDMQAYADGRAGINPEAPEILGQEAIRYVDVMRRNLLGTMNAAKDSSDKRLAGKMYGSFLDWIDAAAEQNLISGGPLAAQAMRDARGATKQFMELFQPKGLQGKGVTNTLKKVEGAETGEEVLRSLLGSGGPQSSLADGVVKSVKHYKAATLKLGGKEGADAWNDLRIAHWVSLVSDASKTMKTPHMMSKNIRSAMSKQASLMKTLYSEKERKLMMQFEDAANAINWRPHDINPGGTGTVNRSAMAHVAEEQIRFNAQAARAKGTMRGDKIKLIQSRLWRMLGAYIKGAEKPGGRVVANRAMSQEVTKKRPPAVGGYAAALVPQLSKEDRTPRFAAPGLRR